MKKYPCFLLPAVCLAAAGIAVPAGQIAPLPGVSLSVAEAGPVVPVKAQGRRQDFDAGWSFYLGDPAGAAQPGFRDAAWRVLNVPHDWSIELPFNKDSAGGHSSGCLDGGTGWYRKAFTLPAQAQGKKVFIDFDGVYMNSKVYLNGHLLGYRPYGYSSFQYDMTPYLTKDGSPNVLAVRVENNLPTSRWYSGSGIFRNVWLNVLDPVHLTHWGTYIQTPQVTLDAKDARRASYAHVKTEAQVTNTSDKDTEVTLVSRVLDAKGRTVGTCTRKAKIAAGSSLTLNPSFDLRSAALWSVDAPVLYTLENKVTIGGKTVDQEQTKFGIRSLRFDPDEGFFLNGKHMKLHGVCLHHDEGSLGAAWNETAMRRELSIMKDMGVNALRTSHNPPVPEFLDLADEMGFVVMDEAFDCWEKGKSKNDYALYFKDWSDRDIKDMVARDRNHPSIILWSIGNEIPDRTYPTARRLVEDIQSLDRTRPVTAANAGGNHDADVADLFGAVGYNYDEKDYDEDHKNHPSWCIFGSETASATRSRGDYKLPLNVNHMAMNADFSTNPKFVENYQCSSYDNSVTPWGKSAEQSWMDDRDRPFVLGQFIWTGFDYIGEPTPYPEAKSSYFGAVDSCGFPKDVYYFYRAQWNKKATTLHLLPDWNPSKDHAAGKTVPVWAYTNAKDVELFLNGKSLGTRSYDPMGKTLHLQWDVPYQPGELKAVAKDAKGKVIATDIVRTSGQPASIELKPEAKSLKADGKDLVYIAVNILDAAGNLVPDADTEVAFTVTGGEIAGVDNGDAMSYESYRGSKRKAFHGKCLLIVKAEHKGTIRVQARSTDGKLLAKDVTLRAE